VDSERTVTNELGNIFNKTIPALLGAQLRQGNNAPMLLLLKGGFNPAHVYRIPLIFLELSLSDI
jgi:hypothetical protein